MGQSKSKERKLVSAMAMAAEGELLRRRRMTRKERVMEDVLLSKRAPHLIHGRNSYYKPLGGKP